jgi:asparagine synthetase B (glutamine-hydrolysing)
MTPLRCCSMKLGAGRATKDDEIDLSVGMLFHRKIGDKVSKGEPICTIYYNDRKRLDACLEELDGVFTYVVATSDCLGMAKDLMGAKPMVLYESDDFVALASEEVAIRSIFPHEIDTFDPYEGEVRVWQL